MLREFFLLLSGFSGGVLVGSAFAAFITLLDIIPRLAQISKTQKHIIIYQSSLIFAVVLATMLDLFEYSLNLNKFILIPFGFIMGGFVGLLASALAEVLNVMPILARRLKLRNYIMIVLISVAMGKVIGSLFHWLVLSNT